MIEPTEIEVCGKKFTISKFPAVIGREIVCKYSMSAVPKLGDYEVNQEMMLKIMRHVSVTLPNGTQLALFNQELVDNHVKDFVMLMKLEAEVMKYNCFFFQNGMISNFLEELMQKLPAWISKMLMVFWEQLSQKVKLPSTN